MLKRSLARPCADSEPNRRPETPPLATSMHTIARGDFPVHVAGWSDGGYSRENSVCRVVVRKVAQRKRDSQFRFHGVKSVDDASYTDVGVPQHPLLQSVVQVP